MQASVPADYVPSPTLDSIGTIILPAFTSSRALPSSQSSPYFTSTANIPVEFDSILEYDERIRDISVPRWWSNAIDW
jgi:hypothetical protein